MDKLTDSAVVGDLFLFALRREGRRHNQGRRATFNRGSIRFTELSRENGWSERLWRKRASG